LGLRDKIRAPQKVKYQANRIDILLHNLMTNGIKFNRSNKPLIVIDFEEKEEEWVFSVRDNGIGVCSTCEDKIFKPFTRLNPKDEFAGNGIGLSISRRIVASQILYLVVNCNF